MDEGSAGFLGLVKRADRAYLRALRAVVLALAAVSGLAILAMIAVTCADVALRAFGRPLTGAFDIVRVGGAVAIACALPYTTAVKGHVSIEFFFHKLSRRNRIIVDTSWRLLAIALFVFMCRRCILYGNSMHRSGEVTLTLQVPLFWTLYVLAFACGVNALVVLHNMLHPNREMIKP